MRRSAAPHHLENKSSVSKPQTRERRPGLDHDAEQCLLAALFHIQRPSLEHRHTDPERRGVFRQPPRLPRRQVPTHSLPVGDGLPTQGKRRRLVGHRPVIGPLVRDVVRVGP